MKKVTFDDDNSNITNESKDQKNDENNFDKNAPSYLQPNSIDYARCIHNGCKKIFNKKENNEKSCKYHPKDPILTLEEKKWPCCNRIAHAWDEFLDISGCTLGMHICNEEPIQYNDNKNKKIDQFGKFRCKNPGCDKIFFYKENSAEACNYHNGQAIFEDGKMSWSCCKGTEFTWEKFMKLPTCKVGWHQPAEQIFEK